MTPFVSDPDLTLYVGDCLDVLRSLPDGSVDCCVTSPPYWGLRDYGTGSWDGGDPGCDHEGDARWYTESTAATSSAGAFSEPGEANKERLKKGRWREKGTCVKCGATRVDRQLGLEASPAEYVAAMVAVFGEVRRVLADHGTLWLNLGDSYAGGAGGRGDVGREIPRSDGTTGQPSAKHDGERIPNAVPDGVKPKDLVGIPWRVAFALQADGWYLRSDIIWAKPNPMPESVTDRPTKAHEYVFLLSKGPRYFFDQEAVREPDSGLPSGNGMRGRQGGSAAFVPYSGGGGSAERWTPGGGRNVRSVWQIATQPYADAHFATFPEELPRRCILAGCPEWACAVCGKARERLTEREQSDWQERKANGEPVRHGLTGAASHGAGGFAGLFAQTVGWSDCGHDDYRPGTVLDPFFGSGTTGLVARKHGRRTIGIELNPEYARMAARRLQQLSLLA